MPDMDKIIAYWSGAALETLDTMRKQKADTRNPEVAAIISRNLKILCAADSLMEDDPAGSSAAGDWEARGSYADGGGSYDGTGGSNSRGSYDGAGGTSNARGRGRHYVRGHYSYSANNGGGGYSQQHSGTLSRMMDAADPREKEILERLLRKVDD